ncbi:PfkB family carbohydrate kinase, partial [Angustibacter aerolatus]
MTDLSPAVQQPFLVVGEALVDVVDRTALGDSEPQRHPGGSPLNVAVGLARLGHVARFATRIGDDADGAAVRAHVEHDGVRLEPGSLVPGRTATSTAVLDTSGAAQYEFDIVNELPAIDPTGAAHLHTGSIGAALRPGRDTVRAAVLAARGTAVTTSYDPNLRPRIIGPADDERPGVEELVAACDVVKASDEDLAWLYPGEEVAAVLARWARLGPALVIVTRGDEGALAARAAAPDDALAV